ncbi:hypothetical protein ACHAPT_012149 [Fusarium lateritium]
MDKHSKIIIIGAGLFGLSTAKQLATEGYQHVLVVDRHMPPVPDGSSSDISRVIRFDYGDEDYLSIAYDAYLEWSKNPKYEGIFYPAPYILAGSKKPNDESWLDRTTTQLTKRQLPWTGLNNAADTRRKYPVLSGTLAEPNFVGYVNEQGGWADASKAIRQLRDECLELGVSFTCGPAGTVVSLDADSQGRINAARTLGGSSIQGDHFVLTAGAWGSSLVPMYNSALSTAQVLAYLRLTDAEMLKYKDLPIYANFTTGWFNFPPHQDTQLLKFAVHGWGYTRSPSKDKVSQNSNISTPPLDPHERVNFAPEDGEQRLRQGLREILPEIAERPFERMAMCWYTDTPSGDFIMGYHPDYTNLFVGGSGSGHAFKFLPVLGKYMSLAIKQKLPKSLAQKWRFRKEYENRANAFLGDGSRGGPERRELTAYERAKLEGQDRAKL